MRRLVSPHLTEMRQTLRGADIVQRAGRHESVESVCDESREEFAFEGPGILLRKERGDGSVEQVDAGIVISRCPPPWFFNHREHSIIFAQRYRSGVFACIGWSHGDRCARTFACMEAQEPLRVDLAERVAIEHEKRIAANEGHGMRQRATRAEW